MKTRLFKTLMLLLLLLTCEVMTSQTRDSIAYKTGDPTLWDAGLDAVLAAPNNHKILLENEKVRVLEVKLLPGEKEPLHQHQWPGVLYIQQAGHFVDYDENNRVIFDSREVPPLQFPLTMWKDPEAPHWVENLSDTITIKLIRVEMKQ